MISVCERAWLQPEQRIPTRASPATVARHPPFNYQQDVFCLVFRVGGERFDDLLVRAAIGEEQAARRLLTNAEKAAKDRAGAPRECGECSQNIAGAEAVRFAGLL